MARAQTEDLIQNFRYRVVDNSPDFDFFTAGFNSVSVPDITLEVGEYREGNRKYTIKQPGVPTIDACTMSKGIAKKDRDFADWVLAKYLEGEPYRTDLSIEVFDQEQMGYNETDVPVREVVLKEAFPNRVKLLTDLDATSSDINLQEIECTVEEIDFKLPRK